MGLLRRLFSPKPVVPVVRRGPSAPKEPGQDAGGSEAVGRGRDVALDMVQAEGGGEAVTESMVERVGQALADKCQTIFGSTWDNEVRWDLARAAIEAMREPVGEMKDAGAASYGVGDTVIGPMAEVLVGQPTKAWQAMIDAALEDKS